MTYQKLRLTLLSYGYTFFDTGRFNLNLVGERAPNFGTNTFDDVMHVAYRDEWLNEQCLSFRITTDPGTKHLLNPIHSRGTGILVPGQTRGMWKLGKHKGEPALVQVKACAVYRDNDRDNAMDFDETRVDHHLGGFNCHKASKTGTSTLVDGWSAGCQVFANCYDHDMLMALAYRSAAIHGDGFTYTLLKA